jgi:dTDP-4-dehydrorhamnose 3,5-epimerase
MDSGIDGLMIESKKIIQGERGCVYHMVRASQTSMPIKEVYFSSVKSGVSKGWKRHRLMWQRFTVPIGEIEFSFIDARSDSKTFQKELSVVISASNHALITVPPGIWYTFKCLSSSESLIVNAPSHEHDPDELETKMDRP